MADDNGNVLDTPYFSYYTPGEANGYTGGLKYFFSPASYDRLVAALRRLPEGRLDEPVSRTRDPGSGVTYYVTLHGVPQHDAYHLGQVSLLKRAFGL